MIVKVPHQKVPPIIQERINACLRCQWTVIYCTMYLKTPKSKSQNAPAFPRAVLAIFWHELNPSVSLLFAPKFDFFPFRSYPRCFLDLNGVAIVTQKPIASPPFARNFFST